MNSVSQKRTKEHLTQVAALSNQLDISRKELRFEKKVVEETNQKLEEQKLHYERTVSEMETKRNSLKATLKDLDESRRQLNIKLTAAHKKFEREREERETAEAALAKEQQETMDAIAMRAELPTSHLVFENWKTTPKREPSFELLHQLLFETTNNIYESFDQDLLRAPLLGTHLISESVVQRLLERTQLAVKLVVQVGVAAGYATVGIVAALRNIKSEAPVLCIDTWTGTSDQWLNREDVQLLRIHGGRPQTYEQFISNMIAENMAKQVLPFSVTSVVGARWLQAQNFLAELIILDNEHELHQTYLELSLFYDRLAPGGIIAGDHWAWNAVEHDVLLFCRKHGKLAVRFDSGVWYFRKPSHAGAPHT
eukprot:GILJ01024463.1.p1 GENE.GILJ01024463.1~~GILJ01024463.1.p1  ORF type:complete len:367 (+),score=57.50 GILJ01024463.1:3-1103(+)